MAAAKRLCDEKRLRRDKLFATPFAKERAALLCGIRLAVRAHARAAAAAAAGAGAVAAAAAVRWLVVSAIMTIEALDCDCPIEVDTYELLWRSRVRVYLPETIVFKFGRLDSWFFTTASRGGEPRIKRKRDYTVRRGDVVSNIIDSFCAHAAGDNDIVATWISGQQGEDCKMLHLTASSLVRFLAHIKGAETGHGVLQRWCVPFGGHSCMLRTDWSPHFFGLEMRTNWHGVRHPPARRKSPSRRALRPHTHTPFSLRAAPARCSALTRVKRAYPCHARTHALSTRRRCMTRARRWRRGWRPSTALCAM